HVHPLAAGDDAGGPVQAGGKRLRLVPLDQEHRAGPVLARLAANRDIHPAVLANRHRGRVLEPGHRGRLSIPRRRGAEASEHARPANELLQRTISSRELPSSGGSRRTATAPPIAPNSEAWRQGVAVRPRGTINI